MIPTPADVQAAYQYYYNHGASDAQVRFWQAVAAIPGLTAEQFAALHQQYFGQLPQPGGWATGYNWMAGVAASPEVRARGAINLAPLLDDVLRFPTTPPEFGDLVGNTLGDVGTPDDGFDAVLAPAADALDQLAATQTRLQATLDEITPPLGQLNQPLATGADQTFVDFLTAGESLASDVASIAPPGEQVEAVASPTSPPPTQPAPTPPVAPAPTPPPEVVPPPIVPPGILR